MLWPQGFYLSQAVYSIGFKVFFRHESILLKIRDIKSF